MRHEQLIDREIEGTPEERVNKTISLIKEKYKGVAAKSVEVEALGHIKTLIGLSVKGLCGTGILTAIIERRRQDNGDYNVVSTELESLMLTCLGNDEKDVKFKTATLLSDKLHTLND